MPPVISAARRILPEWIRRPLRLLRWRGRAEFRAFGSALGRVGPDVYAVGDRHAKFNFGADPRIRVRYLGPVTMFRIARDGRKAVSLKDMGVLRGDIVIWCFGGIDVSAHLIKQRDRQQVSLERIADALAGGYLRSVADLQTEIGDLKTVILATIPATDQGGDADFPKAGTLAERVAVRTLLNGALEKYCPAYGFTYLDPYGAFEDPGGALKSEMSDGNVHCGPSYVHLVAQKVMDACAPWRGNART